MRAATVATTFTVRDPHGDLQPEALDAITDHYAGLTPLNHDWAQQPPHVPAFRIIQVELTGYTERDLEDGYPIWQAKVEWEETGD